jgi:hypothetical protein
VIWSERSIARAIALQTLARKCVVLVDNCGWTGYECDVLAVTTDLRIIDIEVKISRADLKADAKKGKWWHRQGSMYDFHTRSYPPAASTPREWPPKVWKHYYALPADIWDDKLLDCLPSKRSGVLLLREGKGAVPVVVSCLRRSTPNKDAARITAVQAIDIARLANLRMWESYERAERVVADAKRMRDAARPVEQRAAA